MSDEDNEFNSRGLDQILKAMKGKAVNAKIGILGQGNVRSPDSAKSSTSNATVGAAHEFGTTMLPQRSFLRMPIAEKLPKRLEESGAFTLDALKEVIKEGSFEPYVEKMAIAGVAVVLEAFDTGGFGQWKPSNMDYKKVKQTLVETHQLRDSISYEVK